MRETPSTLWVVEVRAIGKGPYGDGWPKEWVQHGDGDFLSMYDTRKEAYKKARQVRIKKKLNARVIPYDRRKS